MPGTFHIIFKGFSLNLSSSEGEIGMHHNQSYETVTRMNHSRPAINTKIPTEPCPAYGVVGTHSMWQCIISL